MGKYAGKSEMWIQSRALINRGWKSKPKHGAPRHAGIAETRFQAIVSTVRRTLVGSYPIGARGVLA